MHEGDEDVYLQYTMRLLMPAFSGVHRSCSAGGHPRLCLAAARITGPLALRLGLASTPKHLCAPAGVKTQELTALGHDHLAGRVAL